MQGARSVPPTIAEPTEHADGKEHATFTVSWRLALAQGGVPRFIRIAAVRAADVSSLSKWPATCCVSHGERPRVGDQNDADVPSVVDVEQIHFTGAAV